ncbi:hypothetical protein [Granulosicoccus antarcticus]|uniref:Uncharacterized protein n=1 Tax=Granulosicoccus antarcticus IMCC3135 TaxID=1192854 RepID=A0A2Z2P957_9GAMM|nr:hypothetical protein [Granulosicoccus antarcticus]ASJ76424.1 hypothetical protein IMCC3135_31885 [Granulosicoccus antarcticus IMCC3135]
MDQASNTLTKPDNMPGALSRLITHPTRARAFGIHLVLSLLFFSTLVAMMLLYWFPGELFFVDGGWQGLKLVAMVDLILGPALTLILFKPGKPGLMMDMFMVAAIQIAALGYGFHTTHQQRTVAIVYAENGFNTLSAKDNQDANQQLLELEQQPQPLPPTAMLKVPLLLTPTPSLEDGGYGKVLEDMFNGYPSPQERSDQYVSVVENHAAMRAGALGIEQLAEKGVLEVVERALQKHSLKPENVEFYKFQARYASGIVLFDPQSMQIVDFIAHQKPDLLAAK